MLFLNSLNLILLLGAIGISIPIIVFAIECFCSVLPQKKDRNLYLVDRPKTAVLIPAHNEAEYISLVVQEAQKQLLKDDQLIVIADNCQDDTAKIARSAGAFVIERVNEVEKGKGYALAEGILHLEKVNPPEVVVFLDADCIVADNAIANITRLASKTGRPVQAKYLMDQVNEPGLKDRVSSFALQVKNRIRFLGLKRIGGHSLLTGSGMAFPWFAMKHVTLAGAINADDMKLAVDLTLENIVPTYCESALVVGRLMENQDAQSQRTRWEHGHLQMISVEVPRLIRAFFKSPRFSLLLLALDISIPPLSLLVVTWLLALIFAFGTFFLAGASLLPPIILGLSGLLLFLSVILVWAKFASTDLPLKDLLSIPFYVVGKIPIYFKFLVNPQIGWLSTERDV